MCDPEVERQLCEKLLEQWPSAHNVPAQIERELIEHGHCFGRNIHAQEFSGHGAGGDRHSHEPEAVFVESIKAQFISLRIRAHERELWQRARAGFLESRKIEIASRAGHDKGNLRAPHKTRIAFVEMSVTGENEIWQNARLLAGGVNIGQHLWTGSVIFASGKWRMMHGENQRAPVSTGSLLHRGLQLLLQKS